MSGRSSNDRCRLSVNAFISSLLRIIPLPKKHKHKDLVVTIFFHFSEVITLTASRHKALFFLKNILAEIKISCVIATCSKCVLRGWVCPQKTRLELVSANRLENSKYTKTPPATTQWLEQLKAYSIRND